MRRIPDSHWTHERAQIQRLIPPPTALGAPGLAVVQAECLGRVEEFHGVVNAAALPPLPASEGSPFENQPKEETA
jgi:hypothetical protein